MATLRSRTFPRASSATSIASRTRILTAYTCNKRWRARGSSADAAFAFLTGGDALDVLAAVHQCEECAEDAGFGFIGESCAASGQLSQRLSVFGHVAPHFVVAFAARASDGCFAAHLHAGLFEFHREMQNAAALFLKLLRYPCFASDDVTIYEHAASQPSQTRKIITSFCRYLYLFINILCSENLLSRRLARPICHPPYPRQVRV